MNIVGEPNPQLRVGLYVELELGWMAHPFPKGSFKISPERQIDTIRKLGLQCASFQGCLCSPALPAAEFEPLMRALPRLAA